MEDMMVGKKSQIIICLLFISLIFSDAPTLAEDLGRTVFKVSNLSCGGCVGKINAELEKHAGYIGMKANFDKGLVAIDHGQNLTDLEICRTITSLGYPTKVASESEYDQQELLSSDPPGWKSPSDGFFARILRIFKR